MKNYSFIIKRIIRRFINSWLRPSSFLLEFNIEKDKLGPILIGIFFIILWGIYHTLAFYLSRGMLNFNIYIIEAFLGGMEFILTPLILLTFVSILKTKMIFKREILIIFYTFSIKNLLLFIIILILILSIYLKTIINIDLNLLIFFTTILVVISITWSITLQAYLLRLQLEAKFISLLMLALSTWLITSFLAGMIRFISLGRILT